MNLRGRVPALLTVVVAVGASRRAHAQAIPPAAPVSVPPAATAAPDSTPRVARAPSALSALPPTTDDETASLDTGLTRPQALSIYGFSDFGFNKFYTSDKSQLNALFPSKAGTFVLGNANLFFDAQPAQDWRTLMEIRFTNLPDGYERSLGSTDGTPYVRDNTTIQDFTSASIRGSVVLGSIIIERAETEYAFSDAFHVMAGYFFTPWGIWNVDHGTPTLISLLLPSFMADDQLPSQMLGVQGYGSFYTPNWELGYHAYIGNNRSPSQVDFLDSKAFGGRLFASSTGSAIKTKLGVSGYYGRYADISKEVVSELPYLTQTTETVAYREWMVGADASVDDGPFRLRTEGIVRRVDYDPGKRDGTDPNHYYLNGYVLAAYQLPWAGLEPYLYAEGIHWPSILGDTTFIASVGLNVHFNPSVQLKAQYGRAMFFDLVTKANRTPSDNDVDNFAARLVVSF